MGYVIMFGCGWLGVWIGRQLRANQKRIILIFSILLGVSLLITTFAMMSKDKRRKYKYDPPIETTRTIHDKEDTSIDFSKTKPPEVTNPESISLDRLNLPKSVSVDKGGAPFKEVQKFLEEEAVLKVEIDLAKLRNLGIKRESVLDLLNDFELDATQPGNMFKLALSSVANDQGDTYQMKDLVNMKISKTTKPLSVNRIEIVEKAGDLY